MSGIPESIWKGYSRTRETDGRAFLEVLDWEDLSRHPPAPFNVITEQAGSWELGKAPKKAGLAEEAGKGEHRLV